MKMRKTLLAALLALVAFAGCTSGSNTTTSSGAGKKYPPEARQNFIDNCSSVAAKTGGGTPASHVKACTCVIDKIEGKLSYDDFKAADTDIRENKPLPKNLKDPIDKATADCRGGA
jgi:hypothetical protein